MGLIIASIRNAFRQALTSINGTEFHVGISQNGKEIEDKPVSVSKASALFPGLEPGEYIVTAKHPDTLPTEVSEKVKLEKPQDTEGVIFEYSEDEQVHLRNRRYSV